ncbi:MAG: hypothetical protein ABI847_02845 [Anaerolineales bacterium]
MLESDGQRFSAGPRECCRFPPGLLHAIVEVHPPVDDKVYIERKGITP